MTTFTNGSAKGKTLMLKRTPIFLRVTEENGKFDALNQLEDTARTNEKLYAYKVKSNGGTVHINAGRGRGGFFGIVSYELIEPQPEEQTLRDNEAWTKWVMDQPEAKQ